MFLPITFPLALDETSLPECNSLLVINHCLNNPHSLICLSIRSSRCEPAFHCFTLMTRTEHNSGIPHECCGQRRHMYDLSIKFLDESSFGAHQSSVNRLKRWDMEYMGVTKWVVGNTSPKIVFSSRKSEGKGHPGDVMWLTQQ